MLRSMFAGVSGLRSHQTMMDVVGNNISNINTHGYKSTRATFQDALYQATRGATAGVPGPDADGGVNPMQIGLGSRVAAVDQNFSQGALQLTGRATDVAIQGEGFFVVDGGEGPQYTRAGTFNFDSAGHLVGPGGHIVQGANGVADPATADAADYGDGDFDVVALDDIRIAPEVMSQLRDVSIGADGYITGRDADGNQLRLARIATATFVNPNGLERAGQSLLDASAASGAPEFGNPNADGRGALEGGTLEMSNVDLAEEFTGLIMAQRGFQANARTITTSDEMLQELVNIKR
jgi:flagellar hook protein FlgE